MGVTLWGPLPLLRRAEGASPNGHMRKHLGRPGIAAAWLARPRVLKGSLPIRGIQALAWWSVAIGLCLLLATRPMGVTYDDSNYLNAFAQNAGAEYRSWWHYLIEEPGWSLLTFALSPLGAEPAYRLVLFASPAAFILGANKIAGGRWLAVGWWSWIIIVALVVESGLGAIMYVTTIRQGVATSLFLLLVAFRSPPVAAAALAGTVHSAFLVILPAVAAAETFGRHRVVTIVGALALGLYAILLGLGLAPSPLGEIDLGRRSTTYELASGLNLLGYAISVILFGGALYLVKDVRTPWHSASLLLLAGTTALSVANAGFVRIFLSLNAFLLIAILNAGLRQRTLALAYWFSLTVALALWEGRDAVLPQDSWLGLWSLVLLR